ncbi:hypothetical protein LO772_00960 [Yinghuangia sp. ASG 101]|uniref:hypothetical protein n=1 Tax=Yinghuangia sp. ASG 101 TaxID=2896848 RepID=UPI001E2B49DE|nr:hypothetical protein [Yinghuangia sp. ASG 101]UGQ12213.1 hypothetical protein LO772_00960 [Yinghuangia sp. ASG 101]
MPDEVQDLARAVAANVVTAMGTESWPHVRTAVLDVLARHTGDPAATAWVDSFGGMIASADGREQNSLRDAAYARCEAVFAGVLAARPDAAADIATLAGQPQGFPGPQTPQMPAAPQPPQSPQQPHQTHQMPQPFPSSPESPSPQGAPAPGAPGLDFGKDSGPGQPSAAQQYPPPPPGGMPPMPPPQAGHGQPAPGQSGPGQFAPGQSGPGQFPPGQSAPGQFTPGPYTPPGQAAPVPFGSGPQGEPGHSAPGQYGAPSFGGPYAGAPGAPGSPPGPVHAGGPRGANNNNRMVIGGIVAVAVLAGAIFGGIALFGGDDDDDKCASAASAPRVPAGAAPAALTTPDDCGRTGTLPGASGGFDDDGGGSGGSSGSSGGSSGSGSGDVNGSWSGRFVVEKPVSRSGSFTVDFVQHQNNLTGRLQLSVPGCDLSGPVVGELDGSDVTLKSGAGATDKITLEGKLSGGQMSGTYTTNCEGASGTWTAKKE